MNQFTTAVGADALKLRETLLAKRAFVAANERFAILRERGIAPLTHRTHF
jgi:hypothetical protein